MYIHIHKCIIHQYQKKIIDTQCLLAVDFEYPQQPEMITAVQNHSSEPLVYIHAYR